MSVRLLDCSCCACSLGDVADLCSYCVLEASVQNVCFCNCVSCCCADCSSALDILECALCKCYAIDLAESDSSCVFVNVSCGDVEGYGLAESVSLAIYSLCYYEVIIYRIISWLSSVCYCQGSVYVADVVVLCYVLAILVNDLSVACNVSALADQCLGSLDCYGFDLVALSKFSISEVAVCKSCSIIALAIACCCDGQILLCDGECRVVVLNFVVVRFFLILECDVVLADIFACLSYDIVDEGDSINDALNCCCELRICVSVCLGLVICSDSCLSLGDREIALFLSLVSVLIAVINCVSECVDYVAFLYVCDRCGRCRCDSYLVACGQCCYSCLSVSLNLDFIALFAICDCVLILSMCLAIICPAAVCRNNLQLC